MLCISTSKRMLAHAFAWLKTIKNDQKHSKIMKKVPFSSCTREAHVRLMKKNEEKSSYRFWPCKCMSKHAFAGRNTQHSCHRSSGPNTGSNSGGRQIKKHITSLIRRKCYLVFARERTGECDRYVNADLSRMSIVGEGASLFSAPCPAERTESLRERAEPPLLNLLPYLSLWLFPFSSLSSVSEPSSNISSLFFETTLRRLELVLGRVEARLEWWLDFETELLLVEAL